MGNKQVLSHNVNNTHTSQMGLEWEATTFHLSLNNCYFMLLVKWVCFVIKIVRKCLI